jgi:hypothetical protein
MYKIPELTIGSKLLSGKLSDSIIVRQTFFKSLNSVFGTGSYFR